MHPILIMGTQRLKDFLVKEYAINQNGLIN